MFFVGRVVEIVFPIAIDTVGSPCVCLCPRRVVDGIEANAAVGEGFHVGGGIDMIINHIECLAVVAVVAWVEV